MSRLHFWSVFSYPRKGKGRIYQKFFGQCFLTDDVHWLFFKTSCYPRDMFSTKYFSVSSGISMSLLTTDHVLELSLDEYSHAVHFGW